MSRYLTIYRSFSSTPTLWKSFLSQNYKSSKLWNERLNCKMLNDENIIKTINNKIIMGNDLNNLETDIFLNIASASSTELAQLQESIKLLKIFRRSLSAHTLLPSTHHAFCRLFLDSQQTRSLLSILENRVDYGLFPDFFVTNLLIDDALEKEDYASASRLATLVMLQEEFGLNAITDTLSLYSLTKYVESKPTDFDNWSTAEDQDPLLNPEIEAEMDDADETEASKEKKKGDEEGEEEEGEEEEAQYVRIPFLKNPYFDDHFDVKSPRILCGKALSMMADVCCRDDHALATKLKFIGSVLRGKWSDANKEITANANHIDAPLKSLAKFYIDNLHDLEDKNEDQRSNLLSSLGEVPRDDHTSTLSELAEARCKNINQSENKDIQELMANIEGWSELRVQINKRTEEKEAREKLIAEIKAKKEDLKKKEEYLYFYDNLKKSRVTRIEYD